MSEKLRHAPAFFTSDSDKTGHAFAAKSVSSLASDILTTPDPVSSPVPGKKHFYSRLFQRRIYEPKEVDAIERLAESFGSKSTPEFSDIPAGFTYFGQLVAHELSAMDVRSAPKSVTNGQNATLDLDSVYDFKNKMYSADQISNASSTSSNMPIGYVIGDKQCPFDLQRLNSAEAIVADERGDDLLPLAQFNVLFLKLFNKIYDVEILNGKSDIKSQESARKECALIFQDVIWNEYLPMITDSTVLDDVKKCGPSFVSDTHDLKNRFMLPIEFTSAIFRFGHAMVRESYPKWSSAETGNVRQFFKNTYASAKDPNKFKVLRKKWATNWPRLFDVRGTDYGNTHNKKPLFASTISANLTKLLFALPKEALPEGDGPINLAKRTLRRVHQLEIAGAQQSVGEVNTVLKDLGKPEIPLLTGLQLSEAPFDTVMAADGAILLKHTPLWYYVLKEAEHLGDCGKHLGPFGSRIVSETFFQAINVSKYSLFKEKASWSPIIEPTNKVHFRLGDIVFMTR